MLRKLLIIGGIAWVVLSHCVQAAMAADGESLKLLCARMLATPHDRTGMAELANYSIDKSNQPELRSLAMSVYALSALALQDTNAFIRAKNLHLTEFPEQKHLIHFEIRDCYSTCGQCYGAGFKEKPVDCSACGGTGKCMSRDCSNGRWIITSPGPGGHRRTVSKLPCPVCKGSGRCLECGGVRNIRTACANCAGVGVLFKCPPALFENYRSMLQEMLAILKNDSDFDSQFQLLGAETDLEKRITLCDRLVMNFGTHPRIDEVRKIKAEADKLRKRNLEQSDADNARLQKDLEILRRQTQTAPNAAIVTIQSYIEAHRAELTATDLLELNALKNQCVVKAKEDEKRLNTYYWAGGLVILLMCLSCINVHFYKYTLLPAYTAMNTALRRNRKDNLTDPLRLSSMESRTRVKSKTAEIQPLDE